MSACLTAPMAEFSVHKTKGQHVHHVEPAPTPCHGLLYSFRWCLSAMRNSLFTCVLASSHAVLLLQLHQDTHMSTESRHHYN